MFKFFMENDQISSNQSGYKLEGSSINQLLFITYKVYKPPDSGYDVRGVFLDNSKTSDKIPLNRVAFKLKQNGVFGKLRTILQDYLDE